MEFKKLIFNENLILRESDYMLFSAKKMKIYKFTNDGFQIVQMIRSNPDIEKSEIISKINIKEPELNYFIKKLIDNGIFKVV